MGLAGEGTYGRVLKGRYAGQLVAVKLAKQPGGELSREAKMMTRCRHDYVVPYYGTVELNLNLAEENKCPKRINPMNGDAVLLRGRGLVMQFLPADLWTLS